MERRKEVAATKKKGVASAGGGPKNKMNNKKKGKETDNKTTKSKQTTEMVAVEENKTVATVEDSRKRKRVEISSNWKQLSKTIVKKPKAARTTTDTPDATAKEDKANKTLPHLFSEVGSDSKEITQVLALDCEMVGVGVTGEESMLGRVCIVNSHGNIVYDKFVKPQEKVVDYRTKWSGIRKKDLAKAVPFKVVQKEVAKMLKDRIVVGHSLENDFKALLLDHPFHMTRDTAKYRPLQRGKGKPRSLKYLAETLLGVTIQGSEHSPDEDARAALLVYKHLQKEWEEYLLKKYNKGAILSNRQKKKLLYRQKMAQRTKQARRAASGKAEEEEYEEEQGEEEQAEEEEPENEGESISS